MKKIISIVSIVALAIGLLVSCEKDNVTPSSKSPLKDGVWTNYPDRADLEKDVLPLIMKVSGTDIKFSAFSVEKGDIKYDSCEPVLTYDESSNKGTVTIPSIGEYGGTSTFSMEGEGMMVCVTPKLDTIHLAWCGESAEDWWKERPKRDFVIPEGDGLSKDLGVGREMMNLARTIFNDSPEGGAQTKAEVEIDETGKNVFSALSSSYNAFSWCMAIGGKNVTPAILAQLYKINRQLKVINAKLDLALSYLEKITTQIDFDSFATAINDRNDRLFELYNHYHSYDDLLQKFVEIPEEQRDNAYYSEVCDSLKWASNDQAIEDLLNTIDFLPTVKYQNGGKLKSGMSSVYDDLLLATVGFEHEFGIGGEIMRLEDISVILYAAQYVRLYLEALKNLGKRTLTYKDPSSLLDDLEEALKKMQENYDAHNVNLDEIRKRRVCYIKDAHFWATDTVLYHVDYSKVQIIMKPKPPITGPVTQIQGKPYCSYPTWDFFRFLGSGDPSVLANQNLAEVEMLAKVRDFYCAPGTPEYDNFFAADSIAKVMMLEYEGTPEGQTAPLLIGCKPSDLLYDAYKVTGGLPVFVRPFFGLLKLKNNGYIDDTAPLVYFKGGEY